MIYYYRYQFHLTRIPQNNTITIFMNTTIIRLGMCICIVSLLYSTSYAAIEDRFFCSFQNNTIVISLDPTSWRLCNSVSQPIQSRISQLQRSIQKAELYQRYTTDRAYRASVVRKLKSQLNPRQNLSDEINKSTKTFKSLLFKQYYRIMYEDLSKDTQRIDQRILLLRSIIQHTHRTNHSITADQLDIATQELITLYQLKSLIMITLSQKDFDQTLILLEQIKTTKQFIASLSAS